MNVISESDEIKKINEMLVDVVPSLDEKITNSIYYNKLKHATFNEIITFCREKIELKSDLLYIRTFIGEFLTTDEIHDVFDELKKKHNGEENIGIEYHIETTRIDYSVCLFVIIKRNDIMAKKFIFRFRKAPSAGLSGLTNANMPIEEAVKVRQSIYKNLIGGQKDEI